MMKDVIDLDINEKDNDAHSFPTTTDESIPGSMVVQDAISSMLQTEIYAAIQVEIENIKSGLSILNEKKSENFLT